MFKNNLIKIYRFYLEGFKSMTIGKTLWILIIVKLFIMFGILRLFFFPDFLSEKSDPNFGKSEYVGNELINRKAE